MISFFSYVHRWLASQFMPLPHLPAALVAPRVVAAEVARLPALARLRVVVAAAAAHVAAAHRLATRLFAEEISRQMRVEIQNQVESLESEQRKPFLTSLQTGAAPWRCALQEAQGWLNRWPHGSALPHASGHLERVAAASRHSTVSSWVQSLGCQCNACMS
jgi:hypothetical protein